MATVRAGAQAVLVIVDVQVGVMREVADAASVVARVVHTLERARAAGVPVLWVQHTNDELVPGSAAWQWVPELVPAPGEMLIGKTFNSSFEQTSLDAELARLGASHIVLAGAQSNWCIRATAYAAIERGYDLTLVSDAHGTEPLQLADGTRIDAARVVDELNVAMSWLRYPGRRNRTLRAAELNFDITPAQVQA